MLERLKEIFGSIEISRYSEACKGDIILFDLWASSITDWEIRQLQNLFRRIDIRIGHEKSNFTIVGRPLL